MVVKGNGGFLGLVAIGNQTANDGDQAVDRTAVLNDSHLGGRQL
jgi:hypothetical protein